MTDRKVVRKGSPFNKWTPSKTEYSIWFVQDEGIHPKNVGGVHKFKNILSLNDRSYSW